MGSRDQPRRQSPAQRTENVEGNGLLFVAEHTQAVLEVKFEYQNRRQSALVTQIGVHLAEITQPLTVALKERGSSGMKHFRSVAQPGHPLDQTKQIQNPFH